MMRPRGNDPPIDSVVLLALLALLLFVSPLVFWWTDRESGWLLPYLLWLAVILAGAWVFAGHGGSPDDS
jgi:hypothetical protein